jgi:hypothetical protein
VGQRDYDWSRLQYQEKDQYGPWAEDPAGQACNAEKWGRVRQWFFGSSHRELAIYTHSSYPRRKGGGREDMLELSSYGYKIKCHVTVDLDLKRANQVTSVMVF